MIKIAFDLEGTDKGIKPGLEAVDIYCKKNNDTFFYLLGNKQNIKKEMKNFNISNDLFEIIHCKDFIKMDDPLMAIRRKKDSSMLKALEMVKSKKVNACLSGGNTSCYVLGSHLLIGELEGIKRPGFMVFIPTAKNKHLFTLLDVGANIECSSNDLYIFAKMADIYWKTIFNKKMPSIGLLNIGSESHKGPEYLKETYKLIKDDKNLNFYGNIESRELLEGKVDIVVTDGYCGNMVLKAMEGAASVLFKEIKKIFTSSLKNKLKALIVKRNLLNLKEKFDYKNYAAALVMGCKEVVVKTHGSSDAKSFLSAIKTTKKACENKLIDNIKFSLKEVKTENDSTQSNNI